MDENGKFTLRDYLVTEQADAAYGTAKADAYHRAMLPKIAPYDTELTGSPHTWDVASDHAFACWMTEGDAVLEINNLIYSLEGLREEILHPTETDERKPWGRMFGLSEAEGVFLAMDDLADARNAARPAR